MSDTIKRKTGCGYTLKHPREKCFKGRRWRWSVIRSRHDDIDGDYEWRDAGICPKCKGEWVEQEAIAMVTDNDKIIIENALHAEIPTDLFETFSDAVLKALERAFGKIITEIRAEYAPLERAARDVVEMIYQEHGRNKSRIEPCPLCEATENLNQILSAALTERGDSDGNE